jgi:hypothetical protein
VREWNRRADVIERAVAKAVPLRELARDLGVERPWACVLRNQFREGGRAAIAGRAGPPSPQSIKEKMLARVASPDGKALYAIRGRSVEPVFGQLKEARGVRRFLHRGLTMCAAEWRLVAAAHNLRKAWAGTSPPAWRFVSMHGPWPPRSSLTFFDRLLCVVELAKNQTTSEISLGGLTMIFVGSPPSR